METTQSITYENHRIATVRQRKQARFVSNDRQIYNPTSRLQKEAQTALEKSA